MLFEMIHESKTELLGKLWTRYDYFFWSIIIKNTLGYDIIHQFCQKLWKNIYRRKLLFILRKISHKTVYFYFFLISVVIVVVFTKSIHRGVEDFNVLRMPHTLVTWMNTLLREKTHILSSCTNTKLNTNIFTSIYTVPGKLERESRTLSELTPSDFLGCSSINGFQ